jgi:transcription initiation factor TFIIIB Brf1 subunit/transcription initiation factor TFIIB
MNEHLLKPCPLCGATDLRWDSTGTSEIRGVDYQTEWIECLKCGCNIDDKIINGKSTHKMGDCKTRWSTRNNGVQLSNT